MPTARESLVSILGPEAAAYQEGLTRGPGIALSQVLPAWATQLIPWGTDAEGKQGPSTPGVLSGLYAGVGEYGPRATNWIAKQLGYNTNLPQAPGTQAAQESYGNNARWATSVLPGVQPKNEAEQKLSELAFTGASTALPAGGLVKAVTAGAPAVVRGAAHLLYPSAGAQGQGVMAGTVLGGALGMYEDAQRDAAIREMGLDPEEVKQYRTTGAQPVDLTQPDTSYTVAHPETGAPATVPFPTGSVTTAAKQDTSKAAKYHTLEAFGRPDIQVTTPDFNTTGETGTSLGGAVGYGLLGVLGTAAALRYGGRVLDPAIKLATRQGDQINTAGRVAKFNANLDAVDQGRVTGPPVGKAPGAVRGEAPLPGKAGTVGTNLAQAGWDQTRVLTELSNATAPNSGVAKQMEARIGTINHSTPLHHAIAEQMATGVNKANGSKTLPSWKAILQKYDNLTPDQQAKTESGLYSGDELNTRKIKFDNAVKANSPLNDEVMRHNYRNTHSDTLRQQFADMMADPATADVARSIYMMQTAHMHHAFDMGRITASARDLILNQRKHQIPSTNLAGEVEHALGTRDITQVGWETPPTRAVDALTQHYAKLYEELSQNRLHDDLIKQGETWQKADPTRPRIFNEILDPQGKPVPTAEGRTFTVYRDGVPHTYNIDNSNVHRAFKNNIVQTRMLLNTADSLRRSFQSGTTGLTAMAVAQRPFAAISLNRNIPQIAVDRTPGTHFGLIDKWMQQGTGGKIGYRGPEPSQWIGSYNEAIKGSVAVTARAMSDALKRDGNPVAKTLRALKGDVWVDAWSKKLEQQYLTSNAAQRRAEGAAGAGSAGLYERPTYNISRGSGVGYSPMADVVPGVFHPDGIRMPYTRIHIPGTKGATSAYINMRTLAREIHQEIMDGANSYYWKGMRDDPRISPEQRTFETRRVVGDPTMHGASVAAQRASHLVPWINPSVQDAVRMMRNLRDNPIAFTLGTSYTLGMMATASILSAMLGGNKHLNRLASHMSTHDRASNMTLFHNPSDDSDYTQISLPQRWRMLYPILLESVSEALGVFNLHQGEDTYNRIVHSLADLWNHHISHSTAVSAREGLEDFVGIAQPSPVLQLGAALVGKKINEPISTVIQNVAEGKKPTANIISDADKPGKLPGQAAGSSYMSNNDSNWAHQVLSAIFGIAGDGYTMATTLGSRVAHTHDIADAFSGLLTDAGQSWRDHAAFGNMIWGNNMKETARNPIAESNRIAWDSMMNMPKRSDIQLEGFTRSGGAPIGISGQPKVNHDPTILKMLVTVNNYTSRMSKTIEPRINDIRKQLADVDNDPHLDSQTRRRVHNDLVAKKNGIEGQKNEEIELLNATLSWMAGGKHADVRTFDPSRGMEQFHD